MGVISKRRESRRRKRVGRRERSPEEREAAREARVEETAVEEDEEAPDDVARGVSWTGAIGASLGTLVMGLIAIGVLIDPGSGSRWWALLFGMPAFGFLPALRASVRPSANRRRIQRGTVIGCLLTVLLSSVVLGGVGLLIAVVLMPATALLAIAAGLVFQGRPQTPEKTRR